jgi:hypothetical protein
MLCIFWLLYLNKVLLYFDLPTLSIEISLSVFTLNLYEYWFYFPNFLHQLVSINRKQNFIFGTLYSIKFRSYQANTW